MMEGWEALEEKFKAATLAIAEYEDARIDYWGSVARGEILNFPV